jgi:hypothetical protein
MQPAHQSPIVWLRLIELIDAPPKRSLADLVAPRGRNEPAACSSSSRMERLKGAADSLSGVTQDKWGQRKNLTALVRISLFIGCLYRDRVYLDWRGNLALVTAHVGGDVD